MKKSQLGKAMQSFGSMSRALNDLTEEEVLAALELEVATQRRESVLNRLVSRAARLNEIKYVRQLKEKIHAPR